MPNTVAKRSGLRKSQVHRRVEGKVPPREQFALLKRIGYDGVEIDTPLKSFSPQSA